MPNCLEKMVMSIISTMLCDAAPKSTQMPLTNTSPRMDLTKREIFCNLQPQDIPYTFTYDDLYQLKSESGHQSHTYLFDSLSNRLKKDKELHEHNALNQTIKKGNEKLTYDSNGNLTQYKEARYFYDALDRLIQVESNGSITSYTYDPFNRRLSKKQDGQEQLFLYQGQEEIGSWTQWRLQRTPPPEQ